MSDVDQSMARTKTQASGEGQIMLSRLVQIVLLVMACLAVLDIVLRIFVPATLLQQPIDIQTPEALYVKLEQLRRFNGVRVVVFGDSLVFGRTMRDHGDENWQSHTLSAQLQDELKRANPERPVMVANLGMNGMLPTDLNELIRIVLPLKPDLVIFDLTLRSFSREFETEKNRISRPWLEDLSISPDGMYASRRSMKTWFQDFLVNHWYLYQLKDTLQALVFDGQPAAYLARVRDKLDLWFKGETRAETDSLLLLMKARARYDQIDLAEDNPQRKALESVLLQLQSVAQPALAFYATENKQILEDLIERPRYNTLQSQLDSLLIGPDDRLEWIGPLSIYEPANYLDHVHLDQDGYRRLVQRLLPLAENAVAFGYKEK